MSKSIRYPYKDVETRLKATKLNRILLKNRAVRRNSPYIVKAQKKRVNLNLWVDFERSHNNVGDYISFVVVKELCEKNGIDFAKPLTQTKHLYGIGSLLLGYQNATVWGSGFGYDRPKSVLHKVDAWFHKWYHSLDIRAVRGPETKRILTEMKIKCPEVYGDPAVLMPMFYKPDLVVSEEYIVIPHYSKLAEYKDQSHVCGTFADDYNKIIDQIIKSKLVISASLHGIILAEAYGVPAIMLRDTPYEDITKYKDWYYSTGRYEFPIAETVEEALNITPSFPPTGSISQMQQRLIDSFPKDLWTD